MSTPIGTLITEHSISMFLNRNPITIDSSHFNFKVVKEKLLNKDYEGLEDLLNIKQAIEKKIESVPMTNLKIEGDAVTWKGYPIHDTLSSKLLEDIRNGYSVSAFSNFVENLMKNPSKTAIEELYLFIQKANLPITEDGHFLAYKKVTEDYKDCYTKTVDNSIGKVVEMPRNQVDDNRNNTCSYGYHFCSFAYLQHFSGSRIVVLKINPEDVVSIPSDYNDTKGRTCRYEVITEVEIKINEDIFENTSGEHFIQAITPETTYETSRESFRVSPLSADDSYIVPMSSYDNHIKPLFTEVNGRKIYRDYEGRFISENRARELGIYDLVQNSFNN